MTVATASTRTGVGRKATMLLLGAIIACLGVFAFSSQAKAAPVSMDLESGKLNLGFAFQNADILPAPAALPGPTPLPDLWEARLQTVPAQGACLAGIPAPCGPNPPNATVSGDLTGGAVTIAANDFQFPIMVLTSPIDGSPVPATIASTGPVTGTYDENTGDLSLSGPIEARVLVGLATNPLGEYCALPLTGLTLSTEDNADFNGTPFTNGFGGGGRLTGTYLITDDATSVGGANCAAVNSVSKGVGSIQVTSVPQGAFSMDLDYGKLNLGFAFANADILPAPAALPGPTPLPDLWEARLQTVPAQGACLAGIPAPCGPNPPNATVSGDLADGDITIAENDFQFPIMILVSPIDGSPVPATIASTGPVTGTYDFDTGDLSLSGPIEARVLVGLATNPLGEYCALPLTGLTLSTTSNDDFPGVPFAEGLAGTGALTGTYLITDDATSVGGANCAAVNSVSKGVGSIWVSNGIMEPPVCEEYTQGIPRSSRQPISCPQYFTGNEPNCEPIPCPAGYRGNRPNCVRLVARISRVTVAGPGRARRGQTKVYTVRITNNGNTTATGVRLVVTGRGIRANNPVGRIAARRTRVVRLRVRFRQPGRVVARLSVRSRNAGSRGTRKVIRVRR